MFYFRKDELERLKKSIDPLKVGRWLSMGDAGRASPP
jgi:hypothetical protein